MLSCSANAFSPASIIHGNVNKQRMMPKTDGPSHHSHEYHHHRTAFASTTATSALLQPSLSRQTTRAPSRLMLLPEEQEEQEQAAAAAVATVVVDDHDHDRKDDKRDSTRSSNSSSSGTTAKTATTATTSTSPSTTIVLADDDDFLKPQLDKRQYRAILLPNGLRALLVSTQQTASTSNVEAAALHVQAGHFDDTLPGLAHFHEHMLFLGTTEYPDQDEFETYLAAHGGSSNAYTDMEDTNYYFSITTTTSTTTKDKDTAVSDALQGALDRFAQFFVSPLFDERMVEKEVRAIDSEYKNSLTSDAWRNYQLLKSASLPAEQPPLSNPHPFGKFGCGNYETLMKTKLRADDRRSTNGGIDDANDDDDDANGNDALTSSMSFSPRDELCNFWKEYYRTYNMRLCVVSQAPLDALQACVEDTFGQLPWSDCTRDRRHSINGNSNGNAKDASSSSTIVFPTEHAQYSTETQVVKAFDRHNLGKMRETIPLLEGHSLKLSFATPPLDDAQLKVSRPYRFLSHILGHESPGSLHAVLNDKGWLVGLTSGIGIDCSDFSLFTLTLSLTPSGMEHVDDVLNLVFEWIHMIQTTSDSTLTKYHDELKQIASFNFQFRENGDPTDFCSAAAELLFEYRDDPSQVLVGPSSTGEYDAAVARAFMERLRPDNALITICDSDLTIDDDSEWKTEPWYKAKYRDVKMTPDQVERWSNPTTIDPDLHLPALNAYIPTDFTLKCDADTTSSDKNKEQTDDDMALELQPPKLILQDHPNLRMWHKMDRFWKVPKTYIRVSLLTPSVYRSPRSMTLNRIYQRVLNDDLNSFVYDANVAGCNYHVACIPSGYRISVKGYSEKLPFLLETLTSRMLSLIEEMKRGGNNNPALQRKFEKAKANLLRETKNYRLDSPYEVASYNSRLLMEETVWYVDNYIDELESTDSPLTMQECAQVAQECLLGRVKTEALCIGNIDEEQAKQVADVVDDVFLKHSRPLLDVETPVFRSFKFPTRQEAQAIFGTANSNDDDDGTDDTRTASTISGTSIPLVYQELAYSESEENNAVEVILQAGCDLELGYQGVAILELIAHMAYNSAFNQLRTVEQLGYLVSAFARKSAGGSWALSTVVQSSSAEPTLLEERIEAWLDQFRLELQEMDASDLAKEAGAVVAQLLERDTRLSQEVGHAWSEIILTESLSDKLKDRGPAFDRLERIAEQLKVAVDGSSSNDAVDDRVNGSNHNDSNNGDDEDKKLNCHYQSAQELKSKVLDFFDRYFWRQSHYRRAMSSRVYSRKFQDAYEHDKRANHRSGGAVLSDYADIFNVKQYLSTWPTVPYWAAVAETAATTRTTTSSFKRHEQEQSSQGR